MKNKKTMPTHIAILLMPRKTLPMAMRDLLLLIVLPITKNRFYVVLNDTSSPD